MTYGLTYGLRVKIFVRCTTRELKENSLKISAQSKQPFRRSYPDKIFVLGYTDISTYIQTGAKCRLASLTKMFRNVLYNILSDFFSLTQYYSDQ